MSTRRDLLAALVALAATPAAARAFSSGPLGELDAAAAQRIGSAWRERHPEVSTSSLERRLFPHGRGSGALPRLREAVAADFRRGAVFVYRGWRLSETEGALLALLSTES